MSCRQACILQIRKLNSGTIKIWTQSPSGHITPALGSERSIHRPHCRPQWGHGTAWYLQSKFWSVSQLAIYIKWIYCNSPYYSIKKSLNHLINGSWSHLLMDNVFSFAVEVLEDKVTLKLLERPQLSDKQFQRPYTQMQKQTSLWVVPDKERDICGKGALENVIIYPFTINERNWKRSFHFKSFLSGWNFNFT